MGGFLMCVNSYKHTNRNRKSDVICPSYQCDDDDDGWNGGKPPLDSRRKAAQPKWNSQRTRCIHMNSIGSILYVQ